MDLDMQLPVYSWSFSMQSSEVLLKGSVVHTFFQDFV